MTEEEFFVWFEGFFIKAHKSNERVLRVIATWKDDKFFRWSKRAELLKLVAKELGS